MDVDVLVEICREGVKLPQYARPGDAGMDVCAAEDILIAPGQTLVVATGLKFAIPVGYEIQVRPRSGISLNTPLRISNSPGTIDSGYRNELGIIITNTSGKDSGNNEDNSQAKSQHNSQVNHQASSQFNDEGIFEEEIYQINEKGNKKGTYRINKGDRIAQIVLKEVPRIRFIQVEDIQTAGNDRGGGFGSTGV